MKNIYMLVGLPSSGKSTYVENNFDKDSFVLSNDKIREHIAIKHNITYDDTFAKVPDNLNVNEYLNGKEFYGPVVLKDINLYTGEILKDVKVFEKIYEANKEIDEIFKLGKEMAIKQPNDLIIDLTNISRQDREIILNDCKINPKDVQVINFMPKENLEEYLKTVKELSIFRNEYLQKEGKSKTIPEVVFDSIYNKYEEPTLKEGFKSIENIDNSYDLQQSVITYRSMKYADSIDMANGFNF